MAAAGEYTGAHFDSAERFPMTTVFSSRRLMFSALALLLTLGALKVVVAGQATPGMSAAARVDRLTLNLERAESVRAVKRLQETYAQYSQFGLWNEMAALFSDNASLSYGKDAGQGRQAIQNYFVTQFGEGTQGLKPGGLHTQLVMRPVVNVSADGQTAKGRWWQFSMTGQHGVKAEWAAGIFENETCASAGCGRLHACATTRCSQGRTRPAGATSMRTRRSSRITSRPMRPVYRFPICLRRQRRPWIRRRTPPRRSPRSNSASRSMNDEDQVRNLQHAYGYYIDRKMWDDVTDLFATDGALSIANVGVYDGPKSIRRALERSGPAGLKNGQLNDHMQLDMVVAIESGGREARARGIEFGMLGEADTGTAFYTLAVFENRYVKENDVWRIREMRIFPVMKTDYSQGWAKSAVVDPSPAKEHAPDRAVPASDVMTPGAVPVFFAANPVTAKSVSLPAGTKIVGAERLLPRPGHA